MRQLAKSIVLQICRSVRRKYFGLIFFCGLALFCTNRYGPQGETRYYYMFNEGCNIPFMEIHDDDLEELNYDPNFFIKTCDNFTLLLHNKSHIWIDQEVSRKYDITLKSITCCYQPFERSNAVDDIDAPERDTKVQYKPCYNFTDYIEVSSEFIKVSCSYKFKNGTNQNYLQFYAFTPNKIEDQKTPPRSGYNVIILGFSGMSRMNFYRTMQTTFDYLASKGSVELQGYHKVGGNNFVNMMPMLLGLKETEMTKTCWPHLKAHYDNCPFIWTLFKNASYYTALGDDCNNLSLFNFGRHGFLRTPTDYYLYPFMKEVNAETDQDVLLCRICMGNRYTYQILLDYIASLTSTLRHSKLFGFFWETCISHELHTAPELMDQSYLNLIRAMEDSGYIDETILIITSNSGMRWGKIRFSERGKIEERLPVMQILLPTSFRKKYHLAYENLLENMYKLTTAFDVYATLKDLVNLSSIEDKNIKFRSATSYGQDRSISLFLPIPSKRTCADVGIEDHECVCDRMGQMIMTNSTIAIQASEFLIEHLNYLLESYYYCVVLKLEQILRVTKLPGTSKQFVVVIILKPQEGTVDRILNYMEVEATLELENDENWRLVGDIHRTNALGQESRCIRPTHKYYQLCYC